MEGPVGLITGDRVGLAVVLVGLSVGLTEGLFVGLTEGLFVGLTEGLFVGLTRERGKAKW